MEGEGKKKDLQVWPPIDSLSAHETGKGNNDWAQTKGDKDSFFFTKGQGRTGESDQEQDC